ncbi:MAG: hypothetical protein ABIA47_00360 [bacterium]
MSHEPLTLEAARERGLYKMLASSIRALQVGKHELNLGWETAYNLERRGIVCIFQLCELTLDQSSPICHALDSVEIESALKKIRLGYGMSFSDELKHALLNEPTLLEGLDRVIEVLTAEGTAKRTELNALDRDLGALKMIQRELTGEEEPESIDRASDSDPSLDDLPQDICPRANGS